ncbi:hypothetical protein F4779DRAFT_617704 [Xylariaceae sp. FL0662B]|nr:hypothetical protein F4779DRAFT_617704 [Xylariaceae sp. FL0662B]
MSPENSAGDEPESYTPSKDTPHYESQLFSSQAEFLQPLPDTQETQRIAVDEEPALEQPGQASQPTQSVQNVFFSRPAIGSPENAGEGFRFQQPPTSRPTLKPRDAPPIDLGRSSLTTAQNALLPSKERGQVFDDPEVARGPNQAGPAPSINHSGNLRESADEAREDPIEAVVISDSDGSNHSLTDKHQLQEVKRTSDRAIPFPDVENSPRPFTTQHRASSSPLSKSKLPKAISDTRRRALVHMSYQRGQMKRTPKTSLRSPINEKQLSVYLPPEILTTPTRRTSVNGKKHLELNNHGRDDDQAAAGLDFAGAKVVQRRHTSRAGRQSKTRHTPSETPRNEAIAIPRADSQASNISKPRGPRKAHRRPAEDESDQSKAYFMGFVSSLNNYFTYESARKEECQQDIAMLKEQVAEKDSIIQQYLGELETRGQTIATLTQEKEKLAVQNQQFQDELATKRKHLEEKLRVFRHRLNDATHEQQQIYVAFREKCQKTIGEVRAECQAEKDSTEKTSKIVESVRAEIQGKVLSVVSDARSQVSELNKAVDVLKAQLEERNKALERENEGNKSLQGQLVESQKLNEQLAQSLGTQMQELLKKMKEGHTLAESIDHFIREQDQKIETIQQALEESKLQSLDPVMLVQNLKDAQNDVVPTIVAEVKSVMSTREPTSKVYNKLDENVDSVRLLCEGIHEKMNNYEETTQWQERSHEAEIKAQAYVQQLQHLQGELHQAHDHINEQLEERQQLQSQLDIFQTTANANEAANEKIEGLTAQVSQLNQELSEKNLQVARSDESLKAAEEKLKNQARQVQDIEKQIQNDREKHKRTLELNIQQQEQAIYHAINEEAEKLKEQHQDTEKCLHETEKARAYLEREVKKLQREAQEVGRANIDRDLRRIREKLSAAMTSLAKITAELKASEEARESLLGRLEEWSSDRAEIPQMQQILNRLARDQPNAIQMNDQFKEMLEIQKRLVNTYEHHQSQLTSVVATAGVSYNQEDTFIVGMKDGEESDMLATASRPLAGLPGPTPKQTYDEPQGYKRKVIVKSPFTEDEAILPVSVEQERSTRRQSAAPRGIMKMVTRSVSREHEAQEAQKPAKPPQPQKRRTANRGSTKPLTVHSAYNRPVTGSASVLNEKESESQDSSRGHKRSIAEVTETDSEHLVKRQRGGQGTRPERSGQRSKLSRSMSEYFSDQLLKSDDESSKEGQANSKTSSLQGVPLPGEPLGRIAYEPKSSGTLQTLHPSRSQSSAASSQTLSQHSFTFLEPLKEESQDDPDMGL